MTRLQLLLVAAALPFFTACTSDGDTAAEPVAAAVEGESGEELDPNDPNVLVCPVTGVMQRIDDEDGEAGHGEADHGEMHDQN